MNKVKKTVFLLALFIVLLAIFATSAYLYGRKTGKDSASIQVTEQVILDRITDKYFIVTKSIYLDEEVKLTIEENSDWSDILWRDVITANGLVRVDLGTDLSDLETSDITVDEKDKTVTVYLPEATVLNSSVEGDIDVVSKRGLVTSLNQLFEPEAQDYNLATDSLKEAALSSISEDVYAEAKADSIKLIELVLGDLGYKVEFR